MIMQTCKRVKEDLVAGCTKADTMANVRRQIQEQVQWLFGELQR